MKIDQNEIFFTLISNIRNNTNTNLVVIGVELCEELVMTLEEGVGVLGGAAQVLVLQVGLLVLHDKVELVRVLLELEVPVGTEIKSLF